MAVPAAVGVLLKVTVPAAAAVGWARPVPPSGEAATVSAVYGGVPPVTVTACWYRTIVGVVYQQAVVARLAALRASDRLHLLGRLESAADHPLAVGPVNFPAIEK